MKRPRNMVKVSALVFAVLIAELQEGRRTVADLVDATGCAGATIRGYIRALREPERRSIYIAGYEATPARTKMYSLGKRPDAVRPPRAAKMRRSVETWADRKRREALRDLARVRLAA